MPEARRKFGHVPLKVPPDEAPGLDTVGCRPLIGHPGVLLVLYREHPDVPPTMKHVATASLTPAQALRTARDLVMMVELQDPEGFESARVLAKRVEGEV